MLPWSREALQHAIEASDPALLVPASVASKLAETILAGPDIVVSFSGECPGCGGELRRASSSKALVLPTAGVVSVTHQSYRCRARRCPLVGEYLWANFRAKEQQHFWVDPPEGDRDIVILTTTWGVTWSWHQQFTRRILHQHASWTTESQVHGLREAGLAKGHTLVAQAWLKLQLLRRWRSIGNADAFPLSASFQDTFVACTLAL